MSQEHLDGRRWPVIGHAPPISEPYDGPRGHPGKQGGFSTDILDGLAEAWHGLAPWNTYFLGLPERAMHPIGILEVSCVLLYAIPRTAVLGAILVTGYMGGAILTHVRVGKPIVTPVLLGLFAWAGLVLRDQRLRVLPPLRSS